MLRERLAITHLTAHSPRNVENCARVRVNSTGCVGVIESKAPSMRSESSLTMSSLSILSIGFSNMILALVRRGNLHRKYGFYNPKDKDWRRIIKEVVCVTGIDIFVF